MTVPHGKARWAALRALTNSLEPRVASAVLADLRALQGNLHPELLARAIATGGRTLVAAMVARAAQTPLRLTRALATLDEAFFAGGHVAAKTLSVSLSFHDANPYAIRAALHQGATLIAGVSGETKRGIAEIIAHAVQQGRSPREQAQEIYDLVGLTRRQAMRVQHLTTHRLQNGTPATEVDRSRALISRRLRKQRALVIARTETILAANRGQQQLWEQLIREGVLSREARKEWITTLDDRQCAFCVALDGQTVAVRDPFTSTRFGAVWQPALHPQCRCAMGIAARTALAVDRQTRPFRDALPNGLSDREKAAWWLKGPTRDRARRAA